MSTFVENATKILAAAEAAMRSGAPPSNVTILIRPEGTLELLSDSQSPLDTLQMDRGAAMVFRVEQRQGRVRVEGRSGSNTCIFESEKPEGSARRALERTLFSTDAPPKAVPPPARTWLPPPEEWD